jgi:hypothetical protein
MTNVFRKTLVVLAALLGLTGTAMVGQTFYHVEDLGTLPGDDESMPWGISSSNEVVGWSNGTKQLHLELTGFTFDPSNSVLSNSITK